MRIIYPALILLLLTLNSGFVSAQSTIVSSRLTAVADYNTSAGPMRPGDSSFYIYPTPYSRNYNRIEHYRIQSWVAEMVLYSVHTYDTNGFLSSSDTMLWSSYGAEWTKLAKALYTCDSSGRVIEVIRQSVYAGDTAYSNNTRHILHWLPDGRFHYRTDQNWIRGQNVWTDNLQFTNIYGPRGWVDRSVLQTAAGSGSWKLSEEHIYRHDSSGRGLLTDTLRRQSGLYGMQGVYVIHYSRNALGQPTSATRLDWPPNGFRYDSTSITLYDYDAAGNLTREIVQRERYSQFWENAYQREYTWNPFNQVLTEQYGEWNRSTERFDVQPTRRVYHYESYVPAGIAGSSPAAPMIVVSPNPAIDAVRIDVRGGGEFTALLIDMQGRVHQKFKGNAAGGFSQYISVESMPAGTYALKILTAEGKSAAALLTVRR